jgi:hypothetical protein
VACDLARIDEPRVAAEARVNTIQDADRASANETISTDDVDSDRRPAV